MKAWLVAAALCVATIAPTHGPHGVAHAGGLSFDPATVYKVPLGTAPIVGPADAPITIVVWSDFACGYCYKVQFTLDSLARLYPGQIRWVHRTLPLDAEVTLAAEAALAAGAQGRFKPMSDRIYAVGGRIDRPSAELIARELGLDMVRFRADLDTGVYRKQLETDVQDAVALGVTGTPAFFVNGRPVHGNQPLKVFADTVDEELARAAKVAPGPNRYDALVGSGVASADVPKIPRKAFELDEKSVYKVGLGLPGHQIGPDTAPVTIITWGDFQCPFCAKLAPGLAHVREKYGDDVRIIYRHLAMRFHRHAQLAAEASVEAANQGKFWAFHDRLFAANGQLARTDLEKYAQEVGLDLPRFKLALDDRRHRDVVAAETADAEALGVDGTPTMFINGNPVIGSRNIKDLDQLVDDHLAQAKAAIKGGIAAADLYALFMSNALGTERADPSRVPDSSVAKVTLRPDDQSRAVAAACRRRDRARAIQLAGGLAGVARAHAALVCAASGIDLP